MICIRKIGVWIVISLLIILIVTGEGNTTNSSENRTITKFAVAEQNMSENSSINSSAIAAENNTTNSSDVTLFQQVESESVENISLLKVFPDLVKLGDTQINVQIENTGTGGLKNVQTIITGDGFATYEVNEIDILEPKEKGYIIISGNFKKAGNISLKIKIKEFLFFWNVTVYDPFYIAIDIEKEKQKEEEKKKKLAEVETKLKSLQLQYEQLEKQYSAKKSNEYEVSSVALQDIKTFIRSTQASLAVQDQKDAEANYALAENEYGYQKQKLENTEKIKKKFSQILVDNTVLISTIVGGILGVITLVEILRRQKEKVSEKLKNIQLKKKNNDQIEKS